MSASLEPVVRLMLLCDRVLPDPGTPGKLNVFGVVSAIIVDRDAIFPVHHPELTAFVLLAGGRGEGEGRIVVVQADTDAPAFSSIGHALTFGNDPLALHGRSFRILDCLFPVPGLYWVEFRYNGKMLARQPLEVRVRES